LSIGSFFHKELPISLADVKVEKKDTLLKGVSYRAPGGSKKLTLVSRFSESIGNGREHFIGV
jgi:hypothetical protein